MSVFEINNVSFTYAGASRQALSHVSLCVEPGEFVVLCGKSGCGKTTLMRHLKTALAPAGSLNGSILYEGTPLQEVAERDQSMRIGFVQQNPDAQVVTDKVWHELAFGLESLGCDQATMRLRVSEMASYFGMERWFHKDVSELSGGQKQLLNLASIMAMQPSVLILDEPTSQLDPIAAADFLNTIAKINRELGTTVIISEHRLEDVYSNADKVVVMREGEIIALGSPREVGCQLNEQDDDMIAALPAPLRIFFSATKKGLVAAEEESEPPLTVREGRSWLSRLMEGKKPVAAPVVASDDDDDDDDDAAFEFKEVWFRYEKDAPDVIKGLSFHASKASIFALVGGNGAGKTTTLKVASGLLQPYRGTVRVLGKKVGEYSADELFNNCLAVLPQDPQSLFVKTTVREDLEEMLKGKRADGSRLTEDERAAEIARVAALTHISEFMETHPYDLSGGEQQRVALAKVLLTHPKLLLMDEPTKGIDNHFKQEFAEIVYDLKAQGTTVVMVSHDIEFCAQHADRVALFFDGALAAENVPMRFFAQNSFYTTAANRMSRHLFENAITDADVVERCYASFSAAQHDNASGGDNDADDEGDDASGGDDDAGDEGEGPGAGGAGGGGAAPPAGGSSGEGSGGSAAASPEGDRSDESSGMHSGDGDSPHASSAAKARLAPGARKAISLLVSIVCLPALAVLSSTVFANQHYTIAALCAALLSLVPLAITPREARLSRGVEFVTLAVLCLLTVIIHIAFNWIPHFTPLFAMVAISGMALGPASGLVVGAWSLLVSGLLMGPGAWLPWQVVTYGLAGALFAFIPRIFKLPPCKLSIKQICIFCISAGILAFCFIGVMLDTTALFIMPSSNMTFDAILSVYKSGMPVNAVQGTAVLLGAAICVNPLLVKLARINKLYGGRYAV